MTGLQGLFASLTRRMAAAKLLGHLPAVDLPRGIIGTDILPSPRGAGDGIALGRYAWVCSPSGLCFQVASRADQMALIAQVSKSRSIFVELAVDSR